MSANNVVWVMNYITPNGIWHVFYSGCMDNTPTKPDYNDKYYKAFMTKDEALLYAHEVENEINEACAWEGYIGVEYCVCIVNDNKIKDLPHRCRDCKALSAEGYCTSPTICVKNEIKPVLDGLAKYDKTVTKKDIEDFVKLVTEMVERLDKKIIGLQQGLWNLNNRIKELGGSPPPRKDGCYQFTYCNECLAYPMGLGCPNIVKGPVQLKKFEGEKSVSEGLIPEISGETEVATTDSKPICSECGCVNGHHIACSQQEQETPRLSANSSQRNPYGYSKEEQEKPPSKNEHMWTNLTEVDYCEICLELAHRVGYDSECLPKEEQETELKWDNEHEFIHGTTYHKLIAEFLQALFNLIAQKKEMIVFDEPKKLPLEYIRIEFIKELIEEWVKRQDRVKEEQETEPKIFCNKCELYGECDHQGAYKKDGKWCYES